MSLDVTLKIFRFRPGEKTHYDTFPISLPDAANVLDAIEQAWAHHDRTLMFRHACHHASCGTCAVRINGVEKLPCITPLRGYVNGRAEVTIQPLRHFPLVGDLVVDVSGFFQKQEASGMVITRTAEPTLLGVPSAIPDGLERHNRFENCIECGICISACPTMAADPKFLGPAALAAIYRARQQTDDPQTSARMLKLADGEQGVWRCHTAFECTEACPQSVYPAEAIMSLRRDLTGLRFRNLLRR